MLRFSRQNHGAGSPAPSISSFSTSSSTVTLASSIWSAKSAIKSKVVGATSRGVENVVVRRKLASMQSIFPHTDATNVVYIDSTYDDLLEFSRPGLYSKHVSRAALRIIITQIETRQTVHLMQALLRWPIPELKLFLVQLTDKWMQDYEKWYDGLSMKQSMFNPPCNALSALVDFVRTIAEQNDATCQAVLNAGFLDTLLRIYVAVASFGGQEQTITACTSILFLFASQPANLHVMMSHPVCVLWKDCGKRLWASAAYEAVGPRLSAWRRTDRPTVLRRLKMICTTMPVMSRLSRESSSDVCHDLVELSRREFYDSEITDLAQLCIFNCIGFNADQGRHLHQALLTVSHQELVDITSGIVELWLEHAQSRHEISAEDQDHMNLNCDPNGNRGTQVRIPTDEPTFYEKQRDLTFHKVTVIQQRSNHPDDNPLYNIIELFTTLALHGSTPVSALLEGGTAVLVLLALLDGVTNLLSELFDTFKPKLPNGSPRSLAFSEKSPTTNNKRKFTQHLSLIEGDGAKLVASFQRAGLKWHLVNTTYNRRKAVCLPLVKYLFRDAGEEYAKVHTLLDQVVS